MYLLLTYGGGSFHELILNLFLPLFEVGKVDNRWSRAAHDCFRLEARYRNVLEDASFSWIP